MTISALIIDDEQLARDELKYLLDQAGGVDVVAQGANGIEAVDLIEEHHPDVVFLDVQMPGLDGFAVIKRLMDRHASETRKDAEPLPQVVFATAYDQYAVRAFDVNAVDYLLKPFDRARVQQALERVRGRMAGNSPGSVARSTNWRAVEAAESRAGRNAGAAISTGSSCRHRAGCCSWTRQRFASRQSTKA